MATNQELVHIQTWGQCNPLAKHLKCPPPHPQSKKKVGERTFFSLFKSSLVPLWISLKCQNLLAQCIFCLFLGLGNKEKNSRAQAPYFPEDSRGGGGMSRTRQVALRDCLSRLSLLDTEHKEVEANTRGNRLFKLASISKDPTRVWERCLTRGSGGIPDLGEKGELQLLWPE